MSPPAAIQGQLVSIKNVSTHKSACLTIHVPEEQALQAIEAFGWPTMVNPVPVALARIDLNAKPERKGGKLAQRAGILCFEGGFQKFIAERVAKMAGMVAPVEGNISPEDIAVFVRHHCGVKSRAELDHDVEAARKFNALEIEYRAWLSVPA